jgi:hypothetical protein
VDAILLDRLELHPISTNEFAVEAYLAKAARQNAVAG